MNFYTVSISDSLTDTSEHLQLPGPSDLLTWELNNSLPELYAAVRVGSQITD